jgi:inorganic triphosphatase YgiF
MGTELELKLELDPRNAGSVAKQALSGGAEQRTRREVSVYYDTAAGKLRKKGYTLRVRSTPEGFTQTLKTAETGAGLFFRGEWEKPVKSIEPYVEALEDTPAAHIATKKLKPFIRAEVDRTIWQRQVNGSLLEFAFDQGALHASGRKAPVLELEIELLDGRPEAAFDAARDLAESLPVKIGVLSKAERGFALADGALSKPTKALPVPVHQAMNVADGFAVIAQSCLKHFRHNEPVILTTRDPAALHQARVAMRRLRSALSLFRPAIADQEFERLREELRWFTGQLGEARNLDVYLGRDLPEELREGLTAQRELAYDNVIEALHSKRFRLLMIAVVRWIALGEWRSSDKASRPLPEFARRRVDRLWHKLIAHENLRSMDDEGRHEVRIEIKKLRYALEFLQALHAGAVGTQKQFLKAVESLQETLGHLNDIVTARDFALAELPNQSDPSEEPALIKKAQRRFRRLKNMGAYWSEPTR